MRRARHRVLCAVLLLALPLAGHARQDPAPAPQPASPAAEAVSLEQAYKREYAFLTAQKRELQQRLGEARARFARERAGLDQELAALEGQLVTARAEADALADAVAAAQQAEAVNADNSELVAATLEQAAATLGGLGVDTLAAEDYAALDGRARLDTLFATAQQTLAALGTLRQQQGRFFLRDGSETEGTLLHWGKVASWGVSEAGAGVLVPAGGGRFRLWDAPAEAAARQLAEGRFSDPMPVYLYENANAAVADPEQATLLGEVRKGGMIGWIIVVLGLAGLLLALLRAVFLKRASASIQDIMDGVAPHLRGGRAEDAIAAAKRHKGSAARVVTAALRNLDRDREHLEDIVSESILHESVHLNRFGALITVIAAVAPLLGLLGTVTGMIQTFDVITAFGTADPKLLSGGIAIALVTTELGLAVAIPMILLGAVLNGWAERIKDGMEGAALKVINLFQDVRARSAARPAQAA